MVQWGQWGVQCEATTGHPAENSGPEQGSTPEQRAAGRLLSGGTTLRLLGAEGGVTRGARQFLGSLGTQNRGPRHNGPGFQGQSELRFCGAGSAQTGWVARRGPGGPGGRHEDPQ